MSLSVERKVFATVAAMALSAGAGAQEIDPAQLTLESSVIRALSQNLSRLAQDAEYELAGLGVQKEKGAFEPALTASARKEENNRENTVEQFRNQLTSFFEEENLRYDLGVEGQLPTGGKYRLGYSLNDLSNNLTNSVVTIPFESQFQSFLGATVSQPLLRGGGLATGLAGVRLAEAQRVVQYHNLRKEMISVAAQTEAAYWDLALAQDLLEIRANSVGIAQKVKDDNEARHRQGQMSDVEVLQAEAGLADRQARRNEADALRAGAVSRLRGMFSDDPEGGEEILVATDNPPVTPYAHDLAAAMKLAVDAQPDYLSQQEQVRLQGIRLAYARNQRWPQLDLIGSYGYNGLAEDANAAWDESTNADYPAWSIGVQLSVGLGGDRRQAAELKAAQLQKAQALRKLKEVELTIYRTLEAGLHEATSLLDNIGKIDRIASVRKRLLDLELEKLEAGRSDSRSVLAIEEDYLQAREAHARSLSEYQKARLRVEMTAGTLLASRGLEGEGPRPPRAKSLASPVTP